MATMIFRTEAEEREGLAAFASIIHRERATNLIPLDTKLITFNGLSFDLPVLVTRMRLLGVKPPALDIRKYGSKDAIDLYAELSFNGEGGAAIMSRSQKALAARFGIPSLDDTSGADVAQMVAEGRYDDVAAHCQFDLNTMLALYWRVHGPEAKGILLDLETAPVDNAAEYRQFVKPDGRLTDEKKIAADVDTKLGKAGLDPYLCRIVCLGYEVIG